VDSNAISPGIFFPELEIILIVLWLDKTDFAVIATLKDMVGMPCKVHPCTPRHSSARLRVRPYISHINCKACPQLTAGLSRFVIVVIVVVIMSAMSFAANHPEGTHHLVVFVIK